MIRTFIWTPEEGTEIHEGIIDFDRYLDRPELVMWVDLTTPSDKESFVLTHDFKFHPLAIEDVISEVPRPKLDDYGNYLFLVFQLADYMGKEEGLKIGEVDLFLSKNAVVSVHFDEHPVFDRLYDKARKDDRLFSRGADFLFHAVLDAIVDNYTTVLDLLEFAFGLLGAPAVLDGFCHRNKLRLAGLRSCGFGRWVYRRQVLQSVVRHFLFLSVKFKMGINNMFPDEMVVNNIS